MNRKAFSPAPGMIYNNRGGGSYRCMKTNYDGTPVFQNIASGWTLSAHGCGVYPDGSIDWDFSTGGHFEKRDIWADCIGSTDSAFWDELEAQEQAHD